MVKTPLATTKFLIATCVVAFYSASVIIWPGVIENINAKMFKLSFHWNNFFTKSDIIKQTRLSIRHHCALTMILSHTLLSSHPKFLKVNLKSEPAFKSNFNVCLFSSFFGHSGLIENPFLENLTLNTYAIQIFYIFGQEQCFQAKMTKS